MGIVLVAVVASRAGLFHKKDAGKVLGVMKLAAEEAISVPTEVVGEQFEGGTEDPGISWPGEIISLGNVEVQPQREGTIVEWTAKIGQKVVKGQALGKLSAPPKTPELIKMLAEQAQDLAKMKGEAQAIIDFSKKNIQQLSALRGAIQANLAAVSSTLNDLNGLGKSNIPASANAALEQLQAVVDIKKTILRKTIELTLNRQVQKFSNTVSNPINFQVSYLKFGFGAADSFTAKNYEAYVFKLANELKDPEALPLATAKNLAQAAIRLVNASIATEYLPLSDLRQMANDDQINFLAAIKEYEEAKAELAMQEVEYKDRQVELNERNTEYGLTQLEQEKEYAEQLKEINEKIAMLEKDQQMAKVNVKASAAAYGTVARSINEGLIIVATQAGTVSAIYKQNGDFVEPGMPVASINTGDKTQRFVRFHIPSNLPIPEAGTSLTIMRPGYPQEVKKVKLIGAGTALGVNGAFVADAEFVDPINWPVRISVRVMPPRGFITSTLIPFAAVWWDNQAQANVWLVTEEDKIRPQQITIGRTLGDKIEVSEGLQSGNRYVSQASPGLTQGMTLKDIKAEAKQESDEPKEKADGHEGDPEGH